MAVTRRRWPSSNGQKRTAWMVDFAIGPTGAERVRKSGFATRREAEEWEREERSRRDAAARLARLPAEERRRHAAATMTVADLARSWLDSCRRGDGGVPVEARTLAGYEASMRLHILPRIGSRKVADIDGPMLQDLQAELLHARSRAATARAMRHFRQALNHAVRLGLLAASPGPSVRLKKDSRERRKLRMPSDAQFEALIAATRQMHDEASAAAARCRRERQGDPQAGTRYAAIARSWRQFDLMLRMLAATGLRISEVLALRWADLVLQGEPSLTVAQRAGQDGALGAPKSATSHRILSVPNDLAGELRAWKGECPESNQGLVFPSPEGRVHRYPNLYRRHLRPAAVRAGLLDGSQRLPFAFHGPRHFHASALLAAGLPIRDVADQLGHADPTLTLNTYVHRFSSEDERRRAAIETVHARITRKRAP